MKLIFQLVAALVAPDSLCFEICIEETTSELVPILASVARARTKVEKLFNISSYRKLGGLEMVPAVAAAVAWARGVGKPGQTTCMHPAAWSSGMILA